MAKLDIPLHEIIDFVEESYSDKFIRLVKFYKDDQAVGSESEEDLLSEGPAGDEFIDGFSSLGTAQKSATARVSAGGGKTRTLQFDSDDTAPNSSKSIREKLESLSPRQKAYLSDFLNLDMEGRDLMVDLGNALVRFIRQKGMDL